MGTRRWSEDSGPQLSGGVDWQDEDASRQDGELGRKADLKGKIIRLLVNMLNFRQLWL